jgi:hypothetical protein
LYRRTWKPFLLRNDRWRQRGGSYLERNGRHPVPHDQHQDNRYTISPSSLHPFSLPLPLPRALP